jgi:hypothetical protein
MFQVVRGLPLTERVCLRSVQTLSYGCWRGTRLVVQRNVTYAK